MQCLYLVFVGCFILAADALSGSNNDAEFVAGVRSKLFGKCFGKYNCQVERDALEKAIGTEEICGKAEQYTLCYSTEKACNTSDRFNNLTKLGDDLKNRFCGSKTTPPNATPAPTTTGSKTTSPNATPAPTTTDASTTTTNETPATTSPDASTTTTNETPATTSPDASTTTTNATLSTTSPVSADTTLNTSVPQSGGGQTRRKRQTDGAINEAVQRLLNQNIDCAIEMCTDKQAKIFSPNSQTINCTLLEEYGLCLMQSCPLVSNDVQTTRDQCGAASRVLLSSTVLLVVILLRFLA